MSDKLKRDRFAGHCGGPASGWSGVGRAFAGLGICVWLALGLAPVQAAPGELKASHSKGGPVRPGSLQPYADPQGAFKVLLPAPVKVMLHQVDTPVGPISTSVFTAQGAGASYVVAYNDYPSSVAERDPAGVMEGAARGAARSAGCLVTRVRSVRVHGQQGVEARYSKGRLQGITRVYLAGRRLFQTTAISQKGDLQGPVKAFLDSLTLAPTSK